MKYRWFKIFEIKYLLNVEIEIFERIILNGFEEAYFNGRRIIKSKL